MDVNLKLKKLYTRQHNDKIFLAPN